MGSTKRWQRYSRELVKTRFSLSVFKCYYRQEEVAKKSHLLLLLLSRTVGQRLLQWPPHHGHSVQAYIPYCSTLVRFFNVIHIYTQEMVPYICKTRSPFDWSSPHNLNTSVLRLYISPQSNNQVSIYSPICINIYIYIHIYLYIKQCLTLNRCLKALCQRLCLLAVCHFLFPQLCFLPAPQLLHLNKHKQTHRLWVRCWVRVGVSCVF